MFTMSDFTKFKAILSEILILQNFELASLVTMFRITRYARFKVRLRLGEFTYSNILFVVFCSIDRAKLTKYSPALLPLQLL